MRATAIGLVLMIFGLGISPSAHAGVSLADADQGKEVAVTFDDLPFVSASRYDAPTLAKLTGRLLRTLRQNGIPAVGFVIESRLYENGVLDGARVSLLRSWLEAGLELGNHTFSHSDLHTSDLPDYEKDVLQGEIVTRKLMREKGMKERYFRHPFLHTGRDLDMRNRFERFLADHGYRVAPVTIDNSDWIFARAYETAAGRNDPAMMKRIADAYIPYMISKFEYFEKQCREFFGRQIRQVLLVHANALNADHFQELARQLKRRGYSFVNLDRVLQDPAYASLDNFTGPGGITWIHRWAITAGKTKEFFAGEPTTPDFVMKLAGVTSE
jgi:peptidoglycan/xylan/chitin deacetylase (PgdA/CDA1 family)